MTDATSTSTAPALDFSGLVAVSELPGTSGSTRSSGKYKELAAHIVANQVGGDYFDVTDFIEAQATGGIITSINKGDLVDFRPEGHFQASMRQVGVGADKQKRIFVRHVGEEGAKAYFEQKAKEDAAAAQAAAEAPAEETVADEKPAKGKGATAEA